MDAYKSQQKYCMSCQQWKHATQMVVRGGRARCVGCISKINQHQEKERKAMKGQNA